MRPEFGGQGLPIVVNQCVYEFLNSANQAWTMYPGLTHGAYECLHEHGTPEQKALYLPKITTGEWTGTMCLTEPHCSTDLGLLRTKAEPNADGSYTITGNKIFISSGEHDLAENIVHLCWPACRTRPRGSKGISLFIVPKFIPNPRPVARRAQQDLLHRPRTQDGHSQQCHLPDRARRRRAGWWPPNKGLAAMFVMMNAAAHRRGMQSRGPD